MTAAGAFVMDYARYRRLGFGKLESLDFALLRTRVRPILAGNDSRTARALSRRSQLRLVK